MLLDLLSKGVSAFPGRIIIGSLVDKARKLGIPTGITSPRNDGALTASCVTVTGRDSRPVTVRLLYRSR